MPNDEIKKLFLIFSGFSICFIKDKTLMDNTGKTQGITFNIKPPAKAIIIIKINRLLEFSILFWIRLFSAKIKL